MSGRLTRAQVVDRACGALDLVLDHVQANRRDVGRWRVAMRDGAPQVVGNYLAGLSAEDAARVAAFLAVEAGGLLAARAGVDGARRRVDGHKLNALLLEEPGEVVAGE